MKIFHHSLIIPNDLGGMRLDQALTRLLTDYSRTEIQRWIKNKEVWVEDQLPKPRARVFGGEKVIIKATLKPVLHWEAQSIPLNILYEDEALIIINKPAGMVVHPAAGAKENTLLNALLYHCPSLNQLPRAGIIHRLDKDTSGLLIIAKTPSSFKHLSHQLKKHSISRIYQAIVKSVLISGGTIDQPIARHPLQRKRMTVLETGKPAVTHYRIIEKYRDFTRVKVELETGRTHQIRVHFAFILHPLLGDQTYAGRLSLPKGASPSLVQMLRQFKRQALHASELKFTHPVTHKPLAFEAPLPADMQELIEVLKKNK